MFDDLIREVRRLEKGMQISITLPTDKDGFLDRQCPSEQCESDFKVLENDWRNIVTDERVFCPICRHEAPSDKWFTPAQNTYIEKVGLAHISRRLDNALATGVRRFNSRQQSGFITLSLSYKPGRQIMLPQATAELMEQRFSCEKCKCRYSSIGAAFFCPACGHNSALSTFDQTMTTVENTVRDIEAVRAALVKTTGRDQAENTTRFVLEQSLGRLVGAFERLNEALFVTVPNAPTSKMKRGCFQRLQDASELWKEAMGRGFPDILSADDWASLLLLYQRRHVLMHRDGIVDRDYVHKSGDKTYREGQRLVIQPSDVLRLIHFLKLLAPELRKSCP